METAIIRNPTPPPPVAAMNSVPPDEVIEIHQDIDKDVKPAKNTFFKRSLDVTAFSLFGFFLAFFLGILSLCLFCFYERLHVVGKRRRVAFFTGHILGAVCGLAWQAWVVFMTVVFAVYFEP